MHEFFRPVVADVVDFVLVAQFIFFWRVAKHADNAGDDVVDVGKVAVHVAMVVNLDGFAKADLVGEFKICHVRPA